ncbi:MAG: glycosyltransferase family 2 protein [bacterium]
MIGREERSNEDIELSLAIPFYNEEENVENVVSSLCSVLEKKGTNYELILVNNGSRDKTGEILERLSTPRTRIIHLIANAGYGGGIITGLHYCRGSYLGYSWGDDQIKAEDVLAVYEKVRSEGVDWGKGLRIERNYSRQRKIISKVYNILFRAFFQIPSKDINGVPKIFRRDTFEKLDISSTDWFVDAEVMFKSQLHDFRFTEIPVVFHKRTKGQSNVNILTVIEFVVNMIRYGRGNKFNTHA